MPKLNVPIQINGGNINAYNWNYVPSLYPLDRELYLYDPSLDNPIDGNETPYPMLFVGSHNRLGDYTTEVNITGFSFTTYRISSENTRENLFSFSTPQPAKDNRQFPYQCIIGGFNVTKIERTVSSSNSDEFEFNPVNSNNQISLIDFNIRSLRKITLRRSAGTNLYPGVYGTTFPANPENGQLYFKLA